MADPKDIEQVESGYDVSGLDSADDYDTSLLDVKPAAPEFSMGRLGGQFVESIKEFPANVARTVRSFTDASAPYPTTSEADTIYDKKDVFMDSFARYGVQDKIRVQNRQNEFIAEGMPKNEAFKKALLENRAEGIQQYNEMQKRRQGQVEEGLEFLGQVEQQFKKSKEFETSSGFAEDVAGGIGTSLPSLVGYAVGGPVLSSALMYSQLHGSKIKELEDLGVTEPDAKLKSAIFSAVVQTPLETVSNLFMLSKVMKANGTWGNWLLHTIEGMGGEGLTEFVQQYPDSFATIMALNPDVSNANLVRWFGSNIGTFTKDALYAGAVGAVSGGVMTGAGAAANIQINSYIHPEQKAKNEERNARGAVLVDKVEQGTATPEQQAELASMLGAGPDADINKIVKDVKKNLVLNQPIKTPERDAAHEAMTTKLGADVADIEIGVFDAMARSWADRTGNKPDAFYTDVVGLRLEDDGAGNQVLIQDTVGTEASLFQSGKANVWYSQMGNVLAQKLPGKADPQQMAQTIEAFAKKGEFKAEELEWSGVKEWLGSKSGKVTKQEVVDYLAENNVKVEEVVRGGKSPSPYAGKTQQELEVLQRNFERQGNWDESERVGRAIEGLNEETGSTAGETVYQNYQLPGGENYRELLLTLPEKQKYFNLPEGYSVQSLNGKADQYTLVGPDGTGNRLLSSSRSDANQEALELVYGNKLKEKDFRSTHYQEPNILAHIRFNERTDADGKRVLFIEEIQSDWAQKGRKEGFKENKRLDDVKTRLKELKEIDPNKWSKELESEETRLIGERDKLESVSVPNAPFVKDTGKWSMLAMKRMVRYAAENGFDRVAWTTGEQQVARYDLSKQVDKLHYQYQGDSHVLISVIKGGEEVTVPGMTGMEIPIKDVENYVGKDVAAKIGKKEGKDIGSDFRELSGIDLKVGGEGMKGFYDKILPAEVNKFFNKGAWGNAKVGETEIDTGSKHFTPYVGPDVSIEKVRSELQSGRHPVMIEKQLGEIKGAMINGSSFPDAIKKHGSIAIAEMFGGKLEWQKAPETVHSLDITPQMKAKAVSEGMPLFQEQEAAPPQGAIEDLFGDGPALIKLFAGADASTPIHEIGHLGLKLLHQSGDTDYNVLAEYAGVDFERSKMGPSEWTRAEHEKVAKAFETYIMEGKSPTTRLQMAFAKLKGWLLDIYKTVKAHGVELNDDVRSVFDRLLTTQYERDAAPYFDVQEWVNVADLAGGATSQAEAEIVKSEFARRSMDAAQFAGMDYDELVGKARELALAKVAKKRQTEDKKVKAQFKKEAVKSIETEPFFLMLDEIMKAGGLKYDNVLGLYSSEWIGELNRQRPGVVAHAGRAYSDDIATQYGYESADDMLQDILNKPGKQESIDNYYNDLVREYESTLHYQDADLYAQVLEQEADILRRMMGKPVVDKKIKGTIRKQTGQVTTPELKELSAQFKRDEQVARNAWNKARKQTRNEERASATEKRGEAVGKEKARQLEKIMKLKLKQLDTIQALRDDYKAKREIKEIQDRVNKVVRMDSIPYADKVQIANFVAEYIPLPPTVRGNAPEMSLDEFLDMRHEGNEYIVDALKIALTHKPQQRYNKAGYRVPLALDEWRVVGDIVTMIHKMSVMEKKLIGAYEKASIDNIVLDMAKEAYGVWGTPNAPLQPIEQLEELRAKTGWFDSMKKSTKGYLAWVAKPQFVFDALGGYKTNMLDTKNYLPWMMIENASDGELKQGKSAMQELTDIFKLIKKPTQWANQKHTVAGFSTPITKEHMVMIALNSGNDGNLKALREGLNLTDEQIENVKKALSPEETQMVEKIWDYLEQFYPKLNQLNIDLTGVPLKKVEGKYFPLVPNVVLHEKAEMLAAKAADVNMRAHAYSQPKVNWGSRHERTGMVMAPELRLAVISNHVAQVLHDIHFQIPVRNVKKIINHPDYRYMAKETIGEAAYNQLTPWLVHVGNPRGEPVVEVDKMVRRLRENSTIVGMGFRAIQILDQMIGFTNTIPDVGIPNMMKAMYHFGTKPNETARFIKESSPMMASFESSWDRDMQEAFSKFDPKTFGKPNWLREAFFVFSRVPDRICKNVAWMSAYLKGNELYSNNHEKAAAYANEILVSTQGSGLPKDLSTWQRGGPKRSEWVKMATMFQTFFSVLVNQIFRVGARFKLGEIGLLKTIEAYTFLIAIPSLFSFMLRKGLPEGDEWLKAPISFMTAGLPIVRDIVSPWAQGYRYQATPAAAGLETASRLLETLGEQKDDKWQDKALRDAFKLSGFLFGLPTGQALTTADGIMDLANGKTNDPTAIFWRQEKPKKVAPHL